MLRHYLHSLLALVIGVVVAMVVAFFAPAENSIIIGLICGVAVGLVVRFLLAFSKKKK